MIKGSIQEEDITIVNIYASNIGASQYIRQMLTGIKGEINTPLSSIDIIQMIEKSIRKHRP